MSFLTCFWLFPQKEHLRRSPPSPMRATRSPSSDAELAGPSRQSSTNRTAYIGYLRPQVDQSAHEIRVSRIICNTMPPFR